MTLQPILRLPPFLVSGMVFVTMATAQLSDTAAHQKKLIDDQATGLSTDKILQICSVLVFYAAILIMGIWAGRKIENKNQGTSSKDDSIMLAGRSIGLLVGCFTMTATWVGGAYINGTAEAGYKSGFLWVQGPFGFAMSLCLSGLLFAIPMRKQGYVTMLDPFQLKYGIRYGGFAMIPAILGEIFWSASILMALGNTVTVILEIDNRVSIVISACIAICYTLMGGLYAVTYTDVLQLFCIFAGLLTAAPVCMNRIGISTSQFFNHTTIPVKTYPYVDTELTTIQPPINNLGQLDSSNFLKWFDIYMHCIFGGIPWQVYFQRVLSCDTPEHAQILSFVAGVGCMVAAVPPLVIGYLARMIDWSKVETYTTYLSSKFPEDERLGVWNGTYANTTTQFEDKPACTYSNIYRMITHQDTSEGENYGPWLPLICGQSSMILPLVLQHQTTKLVACIGIGTVAAAVMSSADSSIFACATMLSRNIYKMSWRPQASDQEITVVLKISTVLCGIFATVLALSLDSVYALFVLSSDLIFCVLFPQLFLTVICSKWVNAYGAYASWTVAMVLRTLSGVYGEGIGGFFLTWGVSTTPGEATLFPFRTCILLINFSVFLIVSQASYYLFTNYPEYKKYDFLGYERLDVSYEARNDPDFTSSEDFKVIEQRRALLRLAPVAAMDKKGTFQEKQAFEM